MDPVEFKKVFWYYSRNISEQMNVAITPICEKFGLTMLQTRILIELSENETYTIGSLANKIHMAGTNISTMCKKLDQKGYLMRVRDNHDERIVTVELTEAGTKVVEQINSAMLEGIYHYIETEGTQSLQEIIEGMQKLSKLLQQIGKE